MRNYAEMLFVDEVRRLQDEDGTGEKFAKMYPGRTQEEMGNRERGIINETRSFFLASISASGWPYVQHRGGPSGFLKMLGPSKLGFADYRGNRQFVTMGNTSRDDRVALILMDYENKTRLKVLGRLAMIRADEADRTLLEELLAPSEGKIERVATIEVEAFDWNCPQYIPHLVDSDRLEELERENERLRAELENHGSENW